MGKSIAALREFFLRPLRTSSLVVFTAISAALVADFILAVQGIVFPVWIVLLAALVLTAALKRAWRLSTRQALVCLCGVALLSVWPFSSRKSFLRAVQDVRPGLTVVEVQRILGRFPRGHPYGKGIGYEHESPGKQIYHHDRAMADRFRVTFEGERVVSTDLFVD